MPLVSRVHPEFGVKMSGVNFSKIKTHLWSSCDLVCFHNANHSKKQPLICFCAVVTSRWLWVTDTRLLHMEFKIPWGLNPSLESFTMGRCLTQTEWFESFCPSGQDLPGIKGDSIVHPSTGHNMHRLCMERRADSQDNQKRFNRNLSWTPLCCPSVWLKHYRHGCFNICASQNTCCWSR